MNLAEWNALKWNSTVETREDYYGETYYRQQCEQCKGTGEEMFLNEDGNEDSIPCEGNCTNGYKDFDEHPDWCEPDYYQEAKERSLIC